MAEIIKIDGNVVKIGTDDGKIESVPIAALGFANPKVGDKVKIFKDGKEVIVNREAADDEEEDDEEEEELSDRSKLAAGLLSIFLGDLGIGNFYRGRIGEGIAQLLLTVLLFWTIIVPIIVSIWALVEGILILVSNPGDPMHQDGMGRELRD